MSVGRDRWCHHIPPARAVVACSGGQHRVTWRRGKVVLEDHDLGAERAMLALGGEPCACLRVLQGWRNLHSWSMSAELFRQMTARLGEGSILAPGDLAPVHELGLLLTWERTWKRSAWFSGHERLLREQVARRALGPLRRHLDVWRDRVGSRRISAVEVHVQRPGRPAVLVGSMDRIGTKATATLGTAWVLRVWGRGLAVVGGAFVLDAVEEEEGTGELRARAVRWEEQAGGVFAPAPAPAAIRPTEAGGWELAWEDGTPL
jgi:hypothetical protein